MNILKIGEDRISYTDTSKLSDNYTDRMNHFYNWMAPLYSLFMFILPLWKKWIRKIVPYISGEKILEVSFGSGYLMSVYGKDNKYDISGIDYNEKMIALTRKHLNSANIKADIKKGNAEYLPFSDNTFDTVINTMALTGYPDGDRALSEMKRVLKPGGKLLIVDFDYPKDRNIFGYLIVKLWEAGGDIIKDIPGLLDKQQLDHTDESIGAFGSVHFYNCTKK